MRELRENNRIQLDIDIMKADEQGTLEESEFLLPNITVPIANNDGHRQDSCERE